MRVAFTVLRLLARVDLGAKGACATNIGWELRAVVDAGARGLVWLARV